MKTILFAAVVLAASPLFAQVCASFTTCGGRAGSLATPAIPIVAIDGSFRSQAHMFENIMLSDKTLLTAIAVGGPMPPQYADATSRFIDAYVQP